MLQHNTLTILAKLQLQVTVSGTHPDPDYRWCMNWLHEFRTDID